MTPPKGHSKEKGKVMTEEKAASANESVSKAELSDAKKTLIKQQIDTLLDLTSKRLRELKELKDEQLALLKSLQ